MQTVFWTEGLRGEVRPGERGVAVLEGRAWLVGQGGARQGFFRGGRGSERSGTRRRRPVGAARVEDAARSALHGPGGGAGVGKPQEACAGTGSATQVQRGRPGTFPHLSGRTG